MEKMLQIKISLPSTEEALENFLLQCEAKNLSFRTINNYRARGRKFISFIGEDTPIDEIKKDMITKYIIMMKQTGDKDRTINSDLSAIRTILYYWMEEGYVKYFKIQLMKIDKEIKDVYTEEELAALLKKPNLRKCTFTEYKCWVLINYLMGTGNRLGTILSIKIEDIDFNSSTIVLRKTKQRKQQIVPLTAGLSSILREYVRIRGGGQDDFLFCSARGVKADERTVQQQIAAYNHKRGIEKTSIHLFRHTYATMYIKNGGDIYSLSKLLGHSSIAMTEHYIQELPIENLAREAVKYNPLEHFISNKKLKI